MVAIKPPHRRRGPHPARCRNPPGSGSPRQVQVPGESADVFAAQHLCRLHMVRVGVVSWRAQPRSWSATSSRWTERLAPIEIGAYHPAARSPPGAPSSHWNPGARSDRAVAAARRTTRWPEPPAATRASRPDRRRCDPTVHIERPAGAGIHQGQPGPQLGVEIGWRGKRAAGQKRALQIVVGPLDEPLASGSAGRHTRTLAARVPRKAWHSVVNSERPPRQRPIAPSPSHTSTRGTAPRPWMSRHQPAEQVLRVPAGQQHGQQPARIGAHRGQHRQLLGGAHLPGAHRHLDVGKPEIRTGRSRRPHTPCARPESGGRYTGRSSATRAESTRIERVQPIRSAITVAGIRGYPCNSSRILRLDRIDDRTLQRPFIFRRLI